MLRRNVDEKRIGDLAAKYSFLYNGLKQPFTDASIEITRQCVFRCVHCYLKGLYQEPGPSYHELCYIIDQLAEMGAYRLSLSGGEPFLRKDIFDIIKYARRKGFFIDISTSAALITDDMAKELARLRLYKLNVSLYGMSNRTYELVTGSANGFTRTMRAIEALHKREVPQRVKMMLLRENFCDLDKFLKWRKGVHMATPIYWIYHPCLKKCFFSHPMRHILTKSQLEQFISRFPGQAKPWPTGFPAPHTIICGEGGRHSLSINALGEVKPCLTIPNTTTFRDKPLRDIFLHDPLFVKIRKHTFKSAAQCLHCEFIRFCTPCPAEFSFYTGKITPKRVPALMCQIKNAAFLKKMYEKYYAPIEGKVKPDPGAAKAPCRD